MYYRSYPWLFTCLLTGTFDCLASSNDLRLKKFKSAFSGVHFVHVHFDRFLRWQIKYIIEEDPRKDNEADITPIPEMRRSWKSDKFDIS